MALFGKKSKDKDAKSPTTRTRTSSPPRKRTNAVYSQSNRTKTRLNSRREEARPVDPATAPYQQSPPTRTQSTPHYDTPAPVYYDQRPQTSQGYQQPHYPPTPQQSQSWLPPPNYYPSPPHPQYHIPQPQYYASPPPQQTLPTQQSSNPLERLNASMTNLLHIQSIPPCVPGAKIINDGLSPFQRHGTQYLNQTAALCDQIATKLNEIITLIDEERFNGHESGLLVHSDVQAQLEQQRPVQHPQDASRGLGKSKERTRTRGKITTNCSTTTSINYFAKVNLYANSRLPPNLPPLKLYMSTYPLLTLAAQYSERVYTRPIGQERDTHVDADWKHGTKAMVLKSVPMDDMHTIVFAIRGSQTFMDWAVNLNSAPASAEGFLDDPGNFCHSGFLSVARRMIRPVAARLRALLEEDPNRSRYSLLITGHSAGGAVASLLYSHMLATSVQAASELNILTTYFKRVHCISFGAPPVSLLPLVKPKNPALHKSIFLSFVNEGDPVPRADKAYVRSLLDLYASPAPKPSQRQQALSTQKLRNTSSTLTLGKLRSSHKTSQAPAQAISDALWPVPDAMLSNAGRIVLLRSVQHYETGKRRTTDLMNDGVVAQTINDELLRGVVWGDPVCHMMKLYARRIEILATNAVLGRT